MITKIYLSDIVLDPVVTLFTIRFIVTKFYFLFTERIYVFFFMVVRTNSEHFLVLTSRPFMVGAACVCCAAVVTESLTVVQV